MALAVHDPDATLAEMQTIGQEVGQALAGFVAIETMQVDFAFDNPAAAPQIAQDALRQPSPQVMRFVAAFQSVLQADRTVQAVAQRRAFVGQMLQRAGGWQNRTVHDTIGRWHWLNARHRGVKSRLVGIGR